MEKITGYVKLDLIKISGQTESITVNGSEFGLEEGGDWSRDRDDGMLCAGFLFIAFRDGFDLLLSVSMHGNSVTNRDLTVRERENDFEEFEIKEITIAKDQLNIKNLFPGNDVD